METIVMPHLLSLILFTPLLGAVLLFFVSNTRPGLVKGIAVVSSLVSLLLSVYLLFSYDYNTGGFQYIEQYVWSRELGVTFFLGVDGISVPMVLASAILLFTGVFVSWHIDDWPKEFYILLLILAPATMGLYMSLDLLFLFFFYEMSVIPMYLFIIMWGRHTKGYVEMADHAKRDSVAFLFNLNQTSKEYAAMKLTLYLSLGAVIALIGILLIYATSGLNTFNLVEIEAHGRIPHSLQGVIFLLIFLGFAPIAALWPLHSWSPIGYAAAPPAASMLHAGVLKKLGHFSILRICFFLFPEATRDWMPWIAILCIINIFYSGLVAFLQKDTKYVIGYASASHMGYIFLGMAALNWISLTGAVLFMFADAMGMGLLFALSGFVYHQTHTMDIPSLGGLAQRMPFVTGCFIVGVAAAFGLPTTANFIAELMVLVGSWDVYPIQTILAVLGIAVTLAYLIRMLKNLFFGDLDPKWAHVGDARQLVDRLPFVLLVAAVILFGLFPSPLIHVIGSGVQPLVAKIQNSAPTVSQQGGPF